MNFRTLEKIAFFSIALPLTYITSHLGKESIKHDREIRGQGYTHLSENKVMYSGGNIATAHRDPEGNIRRIDLQVGYSKDNIFKPIIEQYFPGDDDRFSKLEQDIDPRDKILAEN